MQLSRRTSRILKAVLIPLVLAGLAASANAQLFGPRQIGRNSRGQSLIDSANVGTTAGNRRFMRDARSASEFVGADPDSGNFVGSTQSQNDGQAVSAVAGLREQPTLRVNRPRTVSNSGPYPARLQIDFAVPPPAVGTGDRIRVISGVTLSTATQELLQDRRVQLSPAPTGRSVVLTGTVPSAHDRRIAELLVMFEPGVETVANDLQVAE